QVVRAVLLNPGNKENGGIFSQVQPWAVMAECMLGHGKRAYEYYRAFMPSAQNDRADTREIEPYVHCQSTHSPHSRKYGASRLPWLTGTAAWAYYSASAYIMGLRPSVGGLTIDPCIPSDWKAFSMERILRGKRIKIAVENPDGVEHGVKSLAVGDETIKGNFLPNEKMEGVTEVAVKMG
ncbi:MAG: GH36-type glycosyl hydrolase domain-containing protein, partial [Candidatus Sumerlaeota bacterium]